MSEYTRRIAKVERTTLGFEDHGILTAYLHVGYGPSSMRVDRTGVDRYEVSTVFLSIDHGFGAGPPLLFETMVFDTTGSRRYMDLYWIRYATKVAAQAGHDRIVAALRDGVDPDALGEAGGES